MAKKPETNGATKFPALLSRGWKSSNGKDLTRRDGERWCLIYTKPDCETFVAGLCYTMGIPFFLPSATSKAGDVFPVLSSYLYCRASAISLRYLRANKWVFNITPVSAETRLLAYLTNVHETLFVAFKHRGTRAKKKGKVDIKPIKPLSVGELVEVTDGLFAGSHGEILAINSKRSVSVRIQKSGQSLEANIDPSQLFARRSSGLGSPSNEEEIDETPSLEKLESIVAPVNDELIAYFAKHPDALYELDPHRFEALVADILSDMGYDVTLTPRTRDGGRDILAALNAPTGKLLTIVECKRFAKTRKIGVEAVQRLLWVAEQYDRASCAMLATTSFFSREAQALEKDYKWRLQLKDFDTLNDWLQRFGTWKGNEHSGLWLPKSTS